MRATLDASVPIRRTAPAPLVLDGDGLTLVSLTLDGKPLAADAYIATPDRLTIAQPPQRPVRRSNRDTHRPVANTQLIGTLPLERHLLHAMRGRRLPPHHLFPRPADVMAVYTTRIEADKARGAGAARQRQSDRERRPAGTGGISRSGTTRSRSRPICSRWSAAISPASKTASVTMSGRKVTLRIYVEPGKEDRCGYAMDSLKRSMRWDEEAFGREYDLDIFMIVAVSDFNMGAMENKGLNVFNDKYVLASPQTATDADFAAIEAIIAHEYFHNWTGNRITCRDWFQLCLKEGLTVFRDQEFTADMRSRPVERIGDVRDLRAHQFVEDAGPLAHPVRPQLYHEINNFYTTTIYEKGAEVVRMLQRAARAADFRKGMDLYFERHDGEAATIEQFVQCFADAANAISSNSCSGIRRPARRKSLPTANMMRARRPTR